jgi:hypothetical protein
LFESNKADGSDLKTILNSSILPNNSNFGIIYSQNGYYCIYNKNSLKTFVDFKNELQFSLIVPNLNINDENVIDGNSFLFSVSSNSESSTTGLYEYAFDLSGTGYYIMIPGQRGKHAGKITQNNYMHDGTTIISNIILIEDGMLKQSNSNNIIVWNDLVDLSSNGINIVNDLTCRNSYEYLLATDKGLFKTSYEYQLSNTFATFDTSMFENAVSGMYDDLYAQHLNDFHAESSLVTILNSTKIPIDFSEITETWQVKTAGISSVSNDIVKTVIFEDTDLNNSICASYSNFTTETNISNLIILSSSDGISAYDSTTSTDIDISAISALSGISCYYESLSSQVLSNISGISYIVESWMSGLKDFYIYLPTTNTYYVNHDAGNPGCVRSSLDISRSNLSSTMHSNISADCTMIKIYLKNSIFGISKILNVQINGNSLPLKIYKDVKNLCSGNSAGLFHSFILPSIASLDYKLENEIYELTFYCYGSDAQAIKITVL